MLMRRLFLIASILVALISCARPDYISQEELQQQRKSSEECSFIFPRNQICARATWANTPSSHEAGELTVQLSPDFAGSLTGLLWMPSMGHGSAPVQIEKTAPGIYRISRIYFIMPGDWEVRLFLKNETGENVDQHFIQLMVP